MKQSEKSNVYYVQYVCIVYTIEKVVQHKKRTNQGKNVDGKCDTTLIHRKCVKNFMCTYA